MHVKGWGTGRLTSCPSPLSLTVPGLKCECLVTIGSVSLPHLVSGKVSHSGYGSVTLKIDTRLKVRGQTLPGDSVRVLLGI